MNLKFFEKGIKVDKNGKIDLTEEQWAELCAHLHCSGFRYKYQKQLIKAYLCGAIEEGLKASKNNDL